ncbi:MAG TPA: nucleotidyltransferase family protein [Sphingomicrobium sp.]|nr:nucleotidyltransferase family protein [Sphingomicrobium sp.]
MSEQVDWDFFLKLAARHRVEGLVHKALYGRHDLPSKVRQRLLLQGQLIAADNLRAARESMRLQAAFAAAEVPLLFVKGLPLGLIAYGDPFAKQAIDMDLLVPAGRIRDAAAVLVGLGYRPVPPITAKRIGDWHRVSKESAWLGGVGLLVDLHCRLTDLPNALEAFSPWQAEQLFSIAPGVTLRGFGGTALLAYLAVHGGTSGWFRLKWLSDFAGVVTGILPHDVEAAWQACLGTPAEPALALSFLLSHDLFGTDLPRDLAEDGPNRQQLRLLAFSKGNLLATAEPTERRLGTVGIHLTQLLLAGSWAAGWREGRRQVRHALLARGIY